MTDPVPGGVDVGGASPGHGAPIDVRAEMLEGARFLSRPPGGASGRPVTSDLSIDETLLLHSIGWEPVDMVNGVSLHSVPVGVWQWSQGEIGPATDAHTRSVAAAAALLLKECVHAGGAGVVGVDVGIEVHPHYIDVELVGTAIRPVGTPPTKSTRGPVPEAFASDLSARDFVLLAVAGWEPVGLSFGTSFVNVPRRSAATALQQRSQNVELTNFTEAMYSARESAMERMQQTALHLGGTGVVAVRVLEGPMGFARHAVQFSAWGTAIRLVEEAHRHLAPDLVLSLDDDVVAFGAQALRGG